MLKSQSKKRKIKMSDCIFCKIVAGEIPSKKIYEDDDIICFHDIHPAASVHVLIVPKKHFSSLNELDDPELAGKLFLVVPKIAKMLGVDGAYRTVVNTGKGAGQSVAHIHLHILGGPRIGMPE
jgi:histidine triad (HIT) family protein